MIKKTSQLKGLLCSDQVEFLMEAHSGLSAKIVEESGFKGIWASGLSIAAALGVRDNNEASWTQVLEIVEFMSDATAIPVLLDADTGYGNFNNARRLVRKLEQRGVAGMCIEDKLFPKTNSFISSEQQPLADITEFVGKIKAVKDTQQDPDFCVVARVEALIAGWELEEALKRAEAYYEAGADAILVHSKSSGPNEILAFMDVWRYACPVVIVPTTYYATPPQVFEQAGVSLVIWANHLMRSSITAMQYTATKLCKEKSPQTVEAEIASLKEVFRLQNVAELESAEKKYLPTISSTDNRPANGRQRNDLDYLGIATPVVPKAESLRLPTGMSKLNQIIERSTRYFYRRQS
jgi:phosphoenolpyruvate phosphomutase